MAASMIPFEVHNTKSNDRYYVNALSAGDAIEQVATTIGGIADAQSLTARKCSLALSLVDGVVFDASGKPIKATG